MRVLQKHSLKEHILPTAHPIQLLDWGHDDSQVQACSLADFSAQSTPEKSASDAEVANGQRGG